MSFEENTEAKTTTHYWGYRELSADELLMVGGGDIGDYGDGGDRGYGDGANYGGDGSVEVAGLVGELGKILGSGVLGGAAYDAFKAYLDMLMNPPTSPVRNDINWESNSFFVTTA